MRLLIAAGFFWLPIAAVLWIQLRKRGQIPPEQRPERWRNFCLAANLTCAFLVYMLLAGVLDRMVQGIWLYLLLPVDWLFAGYLQQWGFSRFVNRWIDVQFHRKKR